MVDRLNIKLNILNISSSEICTSDQTHKMYRLRERTETANEI